MTDSPLDLAHEWRAAMQDVESRGHDGGGIDLAALAFDDVASLGRRRAASEPARARTLLVVLATINRLGAGALRPVPELERLLELADALRLALASGLPDAPRAFLAARYHESAAFVAHAKRYSWDGGAHLALAIAHTQNAAMPPDDNDGELSLRASFAALAERMGHQALAARTVDTPDADVDALLIMSRSHRFTGRADAHAVALANAAKRATNDAERAIVAWEGLVAGARFRGDLTPFVAAVGRGGKHRFPRYACDAVLWSLAIGDDKIRAALPRIDAIRRLPGAGAPEACPKDLLEAVAVFAALASPVTAVDADVDSTLVRAERLLGAMRELRRGLVPTHELLVLAAAARWLRAEQLPLAAELALAEYRALSFAVSDGATADAAGVLEATIATPLPRPA